MLDLRQCRSLLYVPAHVPRFVEKAGNCGAEAVVLDLEDSVPLEQKPAARAALPAAAAALSARGVPVLVRVNQDAAQAPADLDAAVIAQVQGLVLPKTDTAAQVQDFAQRVSALEIARGLKPGHIQFLAQVESVHALPHLDAIALTPRVCALNLGVDDFCQSVGATPSLDSLLLPTQLLLYAARRAGIVPLGFAGSVSDYADLDAFRRLIRHARGLGNRGALCIHPNQVRILNQEFAPSAEEIADARGVIEAYEKALAEGRGAAAYRGRMVDAPVVARARATLSRAS